MPYILAIDTSTDACSVAILTPSGIDQTLSLTPREHTQRVLPAIESLLAKHQLHLSQFDAIAFTAGPGSFTGLRIGISVAQGLAYGADLPLVPISTLKTMAQTAVRLSLVDASQIVVPVIDARMDEVYWSAYKMGGDQNNHSLIELSAEKMSSPNDAVDASIDIGAGIVAIGSGWAYESLTQRFAGEAILDFYPQAHDVAVLALDAYKNNRVVQPSDAQPVYMRDEVSWKKRQRIRH